MNSNPAPVVKQRSPVFYVFIGCAGVIVLGMVVVGATCGGCLMLGRSVSQGMVDPKQKAENVKAMLGAAPQGYYPAMAFSVPLAGDTAILVDAPFEVDGGVLPNFDRVFQYNRVMGNDATRAMKDFIEKGSGPQEVFRMNNLNLEIKDQVGKGAAKTGDGATVKYLAARGHLFNPVWSPPSQLVTAMEIECPDSSVRVAVWSQIDPHPDKAADEIDPKGTVLDDAQIGALTAQLRPCGK